MKLLIVLPLVAVSILTGCPARKPAVVATEPVPRTQPTPAAAPVAATTPQGVVASKPALVTTSFKVEGMDCADCSQAIENKLIGIAGVTTVAADDKQGVARVEYDPAKVTPQELIAAIQSLKFRATQM